MSPLYDINIDRKNFFTHKITIIMRKTILLGALLAIATSGMAQDNHSYGAEDDEFKSLYG